MSTTTPVDVARKDPLAHPGVTSMRLFEYPHAPGPHLKKLYNALFQAVHPGYELAPKRIAALFPRDSGKSESAGVVFPTWVVLKYPHLRVAVISKTADLASERTRKAVEHIERYAPEFGVELEKPVPGTEVRTTDNEHTEPTLAPYGLESQLTGKHFDVIIYDDIVDWENQRTETQRRNVRQYWADYEKNLPDSASEIDGGAVQCLIGTRKHPQDLYATSILESNRWAVMLHRAVKEEDWPLIENREWKVKGTDGEVYDTVGGLPPGIQVAPGGVIPNREITVLWPNRRQPPDVLYDLVDSGDSLAIWRRENQLDPEALSGEVFKSEWLIYEEDIPKPPSSFDWMAAMDVAVIEDLQKAAEREGDYSAVCLMAVDRGEDRLRAYVVELARKRGLSVKQNKEWAADTLSGWCGDWGIEPDRLVDFPVESNKAPGVAQRLRDDTVLPARPAESTDNKEARIHDFGGAVESGEVRFIGHSGEERWREFEVNEWLQFPNAAFDDRLDVLAILWRELDRGQSSWSGSEVGLDGVL
jgi:hypothetical protein